MLGGRDATLECTCVGVKESFTMYWLKRDIQFEVEVAFWLGCVKNSPGSRKVVSYTISADVFFLRGPESENYRQILQTI